MTDDHQIPPEDIYNTCERRLLTGLARFLETYEEETSPSSLLGGLTKSSTESYAYGFDAFDQLEIQANGEGMVNVNNVLFTPDDDDATDFPRPTHTIEVDDIHSVARALDALREEWEAEFHEPYPDHDIDSLIEAAHNVSELPSTGVGNPQRPDSLDELLDAIREQDESRIEAAFPDLDGTMRDRLLHRHNGAASLTADTHYHGEHFALISWQDGFEEAVRMADVVGVDDTPTGFFIHPVDPRQLGVETTTTEARVRQAMGFEADLDHDDLDGLPLRTATRVQGDLKITPLLHYESAIPAVARRRFAQGLCEALEMQYGTPEATQLRSTTRLFYDVKAETMRAHVYDSFATAGRPVFRGEFSAEENPGRAHLNTRIATTFTQLANESPRVMLPDEAEPDAGDTEVDSLPLPIDNHLLRFDSGFISPLSTADTEPVLVSVPQAGTVSITHAEHPEKRIPLDPGLYEVALLRRGRVPDAFTAPRY